MLDVAAEEEELIALEKKALLRFQSADWHGTGGRDAEGSAVSRRHHQLDRLRGDGGRQFRQNGQDGIRTQEVRFTLLTRQPNWLLESDNWT